MSLKSINFLRILILFIFFSSAIFTKSSYSQTIINTYYVIPPTSGCNGVWAMENFQLYCGGIFSTKMNPFGCTNITSGSIVGDTLFLELCSIPCEMQVTTDSGMICFCGTFLPNEIIVNTLNEKIQLFSDYYEWHIKADLNTSSTLEIFDLVGKIIFKENFFKEISVSKNYFQAGVFVFKISNGNTSKQFKVVLNN